MDSVTELDYFDCPKPIELLRKCTDIQVFRKIFKY